MLSNECGRTLLLPKVTNVINPHISNELKRCLFLSHASVSSAHQALANKTHVAHLSETVTWVIYLCAWLKWDIYSFTYDIRTCSQRIRGFFTTMRSIHRHFTYLLTSVIYLLIKIYNIEFVADFSSLCCLSDWLVTTKIVKINSLIDVICWKSIDLIFFNQYHL